MSAANERVAARFFDEVCNGRKLEVADELFSAGHTHHDPANPGLGAGPEGVKELVSIYQSAFRDAHWMVDETISTGDTVITRGTGTGTHRGELNGIAPTGKQARVSGIWIHRILNGKCVESWDVWDALG